MLVMRLARVGRKNKPAFRVLLQEKTRSPHSKALETLGSYNPLLKKRSDQVRLNQERILYWLSKGAQPSATLHNLLLEFKIIQGSKKRAVKMKAKAKKTPQNPETSLKPAETASAATTQKNIIPKDKDHK